MKEHQYFLRRAEASDALSLAELINRAGEGLPLTVWGWMAEEGESVWDVGRRRAQREEGGFSYRNATVAVVGTGIVAALIGYPLGAQPTSIDADTPPVFVPMLELENEALCTWYVNVLATFDPFEGRGFGTALLEAAARQARAAGLVQLSIIVTDRNTRAERLYRKVGFRPVAERPIVKDGWDVEADNLILMIKDL